MELPQFLVNAPSHFHWNLETGTSKDFESLNLQITEHLEFNPTETPIQAHLFQSFLHMSEYKRPTPDPASARKCLKEAYDKINALSNEEEKNGFLLVAKTNEALIARKLKVPDASVEDEVEDLIDIQTTQSKACVDSVRAFALSRLGLPKYKETEKYYRAAVEVYPNNTQWLFGLALVIRRLAIKKAPSFTFTDDMIEEKNLYEKILSIDGDHALARASLAECLLRQRDNKRAIENAKKAVKSQPNNSYLLSIMGTVFRKTKQFDDATRAFKKACDLKSNDTYLLHQYGLVYRDKYQQLAQNKKASKEANTTVDEKTYEESHKNLLRKALECFSKAVDANRTNNMAHLDKARAHAALGEIEEADAAFNRVLATDNLSNQDRFTFNYRYSLFLLESRNDEVKAAKHLKTAIDTAVNYCTKFPVSREHPKPEFVAIQRDMNVTTEIYRDIMSKLASLKTEKHSEGLKGLAWLHQALGEHDAAKEKYQEYLQCDGKSNDHDAIQQLIKCLIQLDDLEGAREKIQILQTLKPRQAQRCKIECLLRQGELALAGANATEMATDCFRQAVEVGSMDGCDKLADILKKNPDISAWEFRMDYAKILKCCEDNQQKNRSYVNDILKLMNLDHEYYGKLRKTQLSMEQYILENVSQGDNKDILDTAAQVFNEARSILDRVMRQFQHQHYPALNKPYCTFFHVVQDHSNNPKDDQKVEKEIMKTLRTTYEWKNFDKKFPVLLNFLVQIQPASNPSNNWYLALSIINIRDKHIIALHHSQYDIPVVLNGRKNIHPVPVGPIVFGTNPFQDTKNPAVEYERFIVRDLARKVTTEVEKIVAEFHKTFPNPAGVT